MDMSKSLIVIAPSELPIFYKKKLAIFDRDGTIIKLSPYPKGNDEFELIRPIVGLMKICCEKGIVTAIATNQSGIARGYFDLSDFWIFQGRLLIELAKHGVVIHRTEFCPHLPPSMDYNYRNRCDCRKPEPGMILRLMEFFDCSPVDTFFVGDSTEDFHAAKAAQIDFFHVSEFLT